MLTQECTRAWDANRGQNERHSYEKCQYEEFKERVKKMDELRAAKNGERSN
jgi:NADH dehydrogenase (ubiquinone) 1 beta subcomplex subunit 7